MKAKVKINKILSSTLAVIMVSSTVSIPHLTLASQLADIEIVEDTDNGDSNTNEDTPNEETSQDVNQETSEETESISEDNSDTNEISEETS